MAAQSPLCIYVLGIAGTGVGALAGLLKAQGHRVHGVDVAAYPPMRDKLQEWEIPVALGYDAAHLTPPPDLTIVGNVIRRDNPEATWVREHKLPSMSMPQAIAEFAIGSRHSNVITGTHGKTTTTALTAHLLETAGLRPGFLVGGAIVGKRESFAVGTGPFVIEGDEYDTAYFDKGAKFLHYRARTLVITSLEFDHADIYASVEAIEAAFAQLITAMKPHGHVIVWRGASRALRLLELHGAHLRITIYDALRANETLSPHANLPNATYLLARDTRSDERGLSMRISGQTAASTGSIDLSVTVSLWGQFGAQNALAAIAIALEHNVAPEPLKRGLQSFLGVSRRLQVRHEVQGRLFVDDFAHHPTAVKATLQAARERFGQRRLWAVFEPRSATSRRNLFFSEYLEAFSYADGVIVAHHKRLLEVAEAERFDPERLALALQAKQIDAMAAADNEAIEQRIRAHVAPGDVVLVLSNGDFEGLWDRLTALRFAPEDT